jgi:hypothetical protein
MFRWQFNAVNRTTPSGFEPTIEDLLDTLQDTFTLLGWDGDVIDFISMDICDASDTR